MTRNELRQLADDRLQDALCLASAGRWSAAFYLAGYAVECGLKACVAKLTNQDDFPRDRKFVEQCYTHNLDTLVKIAGLKAALDADIAASAIFDANWRVVVEWSESSRYEQTSQVDAMDLIQAISNSPDGVMPWIRRLW